MKILLLGAGGFIGQSVMSALAARGHEVTAIVRHRRGKERTSPCVRIVECDLASAVLPSEWRKILVGIDVVVNAAGLLRGPGMQEVHVEMPRALYSAAAESGVRRIVLVSAISARSEVQTDYARTKLAGERVLRESGLRWTIVRPSLVYGEGSYGGTSLLRGLAAFPFVLPMPGRGDFAFSPIHVRDLAQAICIVCEDQTAPNRTIEPAGPETLTLAELLSAYRSWLGFGKAPHFRIPMPVMRVLGKLGDWLGSGPISSSSLLQMIAGNAGDGAKFTSNIGFAPKRFKAALRDHPAHVQDRWHARLYFLGPAIRSILVILWLGSAASGLAFGRSRTEQFLGALGYPLNWAAPLQWGTSLLDLALAFLVLTDRRARLSTPAQFMLVLMYTTGLTIALPSLWTDPFGPLLKNLPILLLILVHGAMADRR